MSFGLPLVALLSLSSAGTTQLTPPRHVVLSAERPDVVTSAGLARSRTVEPATRDLGGRAASALGSATRTLSLLHFGADFDPMGARALAPLPAPLSSMIERQVVVAVQRIGSLARILKVTEALACTPALDFEKRGIRVSIGVSGDLE